MKKILLLLCIAMVFSFSTSCGNTKQTEIQPVSSEASDAQTTSSDPFKDVHFPGAEFNILYIGNISAKNLICADELSGDSMNDAIYNRNLLVRDKLGVTVKYIEADSSTGDCPKRIKAGVLAGEDSYSMGIIHRVDGIADLVANNYLYNYEELPYVELDADYWRKNAMQIMSYRDKMFFGYSQLYPISTFCVFFNKQIAVDCALGDIYSNVYDGSWTVDTMSKMVRAAAKDIDGDGQFTRSDQYGLAMRNPTILSGFYLSCGISLSENKGDRVELSLYSDKMVNLFGKLYPLFTDDKVSYLRKSDDLTIRSGQILFYLDSLDNANGHRSSDIDFGLLPYPKYDDAQEKYISFANPNLQCVPSSVKDVEMVGAVVEFMASHSGDVKEAFYEKTLKGKVATDENSAAMVDIMMDNYIVDFAGNYCGFASACTNLYNVFSKLMTAGNDNFASYYETYAAKAQAEIDTVFESLK